MRQELLVLIAAIATATATAIAAPISARDHAGIRLASKGGHQDAQKKGSDMLTVFMTGCSTAADWQSLGLYYSFIR